MANPSDSRVQAGDLLPKVYAHLREMANTLLSKERPDHTLQPTELVHEAYLQLCRRNEFNSRTHFLAVASIAMRHLLVDYARARGAQKRGGGWQRVTVDESVALRAERFENVLAVNEALTRLAESDAQSARVVEMRFFAGMTEVEVADALGISERWARKRWAYGRAWLRRELDRG